MEVKERPKTVLRDSSGSNKVNLKKLKEERKLANVHGGLEPEDPETREAIESTNKEIKVSKSWCSNLD